MGTVSSIKNDYFGVWSDSLVGRILALNEGDKGLFPDTPTSSSQDMPGEIPDLRALSKP